MKDCPERCFGFKALPQVPILTIFSRKRNPSSVRPPRGRPPSSTRPRWPCPLVFHVNQFGIPESRCALQQDTARGAIRGGAEGSRVFEGSVARRGSRGAGESRAEPAAL